MSEIRIAAVGDIMCGDQFSVIGWGVASSIGKHGAAFLPEAIAEVFRDHDLVVGNVECVLSDVGRKGHSLRSLHMRGRPKTASYLAKWGLHVAHVANNHILEHGHEAARDTVWQLEEVGITVVGAGREQRFEAGVTAVRKHVKDVELCFVSACFHPGQYAFRPGTLEEVIDVIEREAAKGGVIVVTVHWGEEYIDRPGVWVRKAAQKMLDCGANLILGHHPHVPQGVVVDQQGMVAYSLGNFIFDQISDCTGWSFILSLTLKDGQVTSWETLPIVRGADFRPQLATEQERQRLEEELERRHALARLDVSSDDRYTGEYEAEQVANEMAERKEMWWYVTKNLFHYNWLYGPQILMRPVLRRLGWW